MPSVQQQPCSCYGCNKIGSKLFSNSWWCEDHFSNVFLVRASINSAKSKHAGLVTKVDRDGRVDIADPKILKKFIEIHEAYDKKMAVDSTTATEVYKMSTQSADVFRQEMRSRGQEVKLYKSTDYGHRKALRTISYAYRRVAHTAIIADAHRSLNTGMVSMDEVYDAAKEKFRQIDEDVDGYLRIADQD